MSRAIVTDFDLEADCVAFVGSAVATGKRLNGNQVSVIVDGNRFGQIIASGAWIRLIAHCGRGDVGDCVSALTDINGSRESQDFGITGSQCWNGKDSSGRVVASTGD